MGQPCNQFGSQEPGSDAEILAFASKYVGKEPAEVFPLLAKADVNGASRTALFTRVCEDSKVDPIPWNFSKFLYGKDGKFIKAFGTREKPEAIATEVESFV